MSPSLAGRVALVTGASRGVGRGIALQLGEAGATVYITGRKAADLEKTCQEVKARGAERAIAVVMDHAKDADVSELFDRIKREQNGKLDILVNNAYAGVNAILTSSGKKFYDCPPEIWDDINNVGLRNHYICTVHASRIMVPRKSGLIVNISSPGGLKYLFNVAYGIGKAACDRMAADCGHELRKSNVTMVSLWPGAVETEAIKENMASGNPDEKSKKIFTDAESVEFAGRAIAHLAADDDSIKKTGKILFVGDLAHEYGFTDIDGQVRDFRCMKQILKKYGYTTLAMFVPEFVRIPLTVLHYASMKF